MPTTELVTDLCISYAQIVDGEAPCEYCPNGATVTISTGADPEPDPVCWLHARMMLDNSLKFGDEIFGRKTAG